MCKAGGHSEEKKQKIAESMSGKNHPLYGFTGKDHPSHRNVLGLKLQKVEETQSKI
jgi:hypothetical protein